MGCGSDCRVRPLLGPFRLARLLFLYRRRRHAPGALQYPCGRRQALLRRIAQPLRCGDRGGIRLVLEPFPATRPRWLDRGSDAHGLCRRTDGEPVQFPQLQAVQSRSAREVRVRADRSLVLCADRPRSAGHVVGNVRNLCAIRAGVVGWSPAAAPVPWTPCRWPGPGLMDALRRNQYLQTMGVDVWVPRHPAVATDTAIATDASAVARQADSYAPTSARAQ